MSVLEVSFYGSARELNQVIELQNSQSLVLVPSPQVADGFRGLITSNVEVLTISKWVSDWLKQKNLTKTNKSQLMLRLSSVWRNYFPNGDLNLFMRSFEIFTEMRSCSLELEVLADFVKELDEDVSKSIFIFWAFVLSENIIDEQLAYKLTGEIDTKFSLHFIGFRHMSGIQIDMLKELGLRADVRVYFPVEVYAETQVGDWIRWITSEKVDSPLKQSFKLNTLVYPSNRLNSTLFKIVDREGVFDVCLAQRQSTFHFIQESIQSNFFYKSPFDLFQNPITKASDDLQLYIGRENKKIDEVIEYIIPKKNEALVGEDYLMYKVWSLFLDAIAIYREYQPEIDHFALKIIFEIIKLNSPRNSMVSLSDEPKGKLISLDDLPYFKSNQKLIMVASSSYGSLKGGDDQKTDRMLLALAAIGPIKRSGLDFSFIKADIINVLRENETVLFIEEGVEHSDLAWKEILTGVELVNVKVSGESSSNKIQDFLSNNIKKESLFIENFSASRMQTYIDCPRKYYFSYVQKLDHRPESRSQLSADEKGILEHKIIAAYFNKFSLECTRVLNQKELEPILIDILDGFLLTKKIALSSKIRLATHYELLNCVQNGITFLLEYANEFGAIRVEFEVEIPPNIHSIVGSIDCVVFFEDQKIGLFDFKRSSAAIGPKKETVEFEKIQLWVYLLSQVKWKQFSIHQCGYLNLSEISDSLIFKKTDKRPLDFANLDPFETFLVQKINQLKQENKYEASPRKESVCSFCEVKLYCTKGIVE